MVLSVNIFYLVRNAGCLFDSLFWGVGGCQCCESEIIFSDLDPDLSFILESELDLNLDLVCFLRSI
jgi:hypothetical protein